VEIAFGLLTALAFIDAVRLTRGFYYFQDDWRVLAQAGSVSRFLEPYNNSLSLPSMVIDRGLAELFGMNYAPERVLATFVLFAIAPLYFFTTRRYLTAPVAALLALPLLFYGRYVDLYPGSLNHSLALAMVILVAAGLNRGPRADWLIGGALLVGLSASGGGLVALAAVLVHLACNRSPLRRWLAAAVPAVLYAIWWLTQVGEGTHLGPYAMSTTQQVELVRDLAYSAFQSVALENIVFTWILVAAFAGYAVWTLTRGLRASANLLAWSAGLVVWGLGLASNRGVFANASTFRYRYTALGLVLLAIVPRHALRWPSRWPFLTTRRFAYTAAVILVLVASARGLAVRDPLNDSADQLRATGRGQEAQALVVRLGPNVVADPQIVPLGALRAAEIRGLFSRYGPDSIVERSTADRALGRLGVPRTVITGSRAADCKPLAGPFRVVPGAAGQVGGANVVELWSPRSSFTVDVRRFGDEWVRVRTVPRGKVVTVKLQGLSTTVPWQIRADGACRAR